ncbi:MAG: SDR family NAD(P)-dependent oxidoreductase, partial [Chloroflexota bacterium]
LRPEPLEALAGELRRQGAEVLTRIVDLRQPDDIATLAAFVAGQWRSADILVNMAGIYPHQMLLDMKLGDWLAVMDLNLTAPFLLTRDIAMLMIEQGVHGSIINVTSGAASATRPGSGHYSTSKAGLAMLTRAYALELAPHGIRVNAVSPGFAPGSEVSVINEEYVAMMKKTIPLGRTSGPDDSSQAILYLCSERAAYVTGTTLTVDGGRSAGTFGAPVSR